jgi:uncharacterized membrane protein (UPF0127 family)
MKKTLVLLLLVALACGCAQKKIAADYTQACFPDGYCVNLELAVSEADRARGLSGRDALKDDAGMLFIFEIPYQHAFWMKDMNFPIDIIWLDKDGTVIYTAENAPPCTPAYCPNHIPKQNAVYVLEVNANQTKTHAAKEGSKITLK